MTDPLADEECGTLGCENVPVEGGYCAKCLDISPGVLDRDEPTDSSDTTENEPRADGSSEREPLNESGQTAFADAVAWFHSQLGREISDHLGDGEHPDRPTTARDYFREERGWTDETIDDARLGYAPASRTGLLDHLMREGHGREAILGTGLFTEDLRPLWQGRYVLPYFDGDGRPVYAISRATGDEGGGAVGYDGHPDDGLSGKYAKPAHTKEYARVEEPIYGLGSVEDGEPVLITEGIADAITAHQSGYSCLSPVTTRFKHEDRERLVEVLDAHDTPRAYVVGDAERAGSDLDEEDRLTLQQGGEGLRGALDTAAHLDRNGVEARVAELPRAGLGKVDLDGYLREWSATLDPVLASAKPAREHPAHDPQNAAVEAARTARDRAAPDTGGETSDHSALFDLDLRDVTGVGEGYRGVNPLGHHGDSENYTVVVGDGRDGVLYDHKHKAAYNALTYLLVEAGERRAANPNGRLDDGEILAIWLHAKGEGLIPDADGIPHRALRHVALDRGLCERADIEDGWKLPVGAYNDALDAMREEYDLDPGREHIDGGVSGDARQYAPEGTAPPEYDPEPFDRERRWNELQGERYEAYLDRNGPHVWADPAGVGKSTNAERGAAARDRPYFMGFDKHAKTRAAITDDATPEGQFHMKGGEQPVHDCCMDAAAAAVESYADETPHCPEHGPKSEWERMCPIYNRSKDDELRRRYEALVSLKGTLFAHLKLGLFDAEEHPWHGGHCRWAGQFDELRDDEGRPLAERVAGVHEYQLLKSATDGRDTIVDESPRTLAGEQRVTVEDLAHARVRLDGLADVHESNSDDERLAENLRALATFADDATQALADDEPGTFADLDAPAIHPVTFDRPVDPEDLPSGVDPEDVERTTWREYQGVNNDHYVERERTTAPVEVYDEPLATAKLEYNEGLVRQYQDEDKDLPTAPFCFDALLAAAAKAGLDGDDARRAIAVPSVLDACPWCGSGLDDENGARVCASDECDWDERENTITQQDSDRARASAWFDDDPEDLDPGEKPALVYGRLPAVEDLPDDPLVLDATATPEKIAGLYGARAENVEVRGDAPLDLDGKFHLTQVVGGRHGHGEDERYHAGGQYHKQTILDTPGIQRRIQDTIEMVCEIHERPLFGIQQDLIPAFEFPENAVVVYYGGARGLNYDECDAVCCIGAPHPDMSDVRRKAELLAFDNPDLRVGGDEYSTRRNAPNPPVYRKLLYEDEHGDGLAVPTKAFSGLVGALFREARENELEQFVHRIRPHLIDEGDPMKHGYLLTDVPTDLAVDEVAGFEELADPLRALFPAPEGALRLLGHARDALAGDGPDGFREGALVEQRDDGTIANKAAGWHDLAVANGMGVTKQTVYNWIHALENTGLLTPGEYEQRRGVSYTADIPTLKSALQVLSRNGGLKVAAVRRFAEKVRASNGELDWLAWAETVFDLSGDRCEWDPPPTPAGNPA